MRAFVCAALVVGASCEGDEYSDLPMYEGLNDTEVTVLLNQLGPLVGPPPPDLSNRYADDPIAAQLGREMFYTTKFSGNGEVACITCHVPEHGYQDGRGMLTSQGFGGRTPRHSLSIIGASYGRADTHVEHWQFWDGRKDTQWAQALGSPESPIGMGGTRSKLVRVMVEDYRSLYESVFGAFPEVLFDENGAFLAPDEAKPGDPSWDELGTAVQDAISRAYSNYGKAIAAFERTVVCEDSRFDAYWRDISAGNTESEVLDETEQLGLRLFIGKARCIACHGGPNLTDGAFYNMGIDQRGFEEQALPVADAGRESGLELARADPFNCAGSYSDHPDPSACPVATAPPRAQDLGAFKTPSLRCVAITAPYMHTGTFPTLESVVEHLSKGGDNEGFHGSSVLTPLELSPGEQAALVAFLRTLGQQVVYR